MDSYLQHIRDIRRAGHWKKLQSLFSWIHVCNLMSSALYVLSWSTALQSLFSWIHVCNFARNTSMSRLRGCCNPCFHGFMSATCFAANIHCRDNHVAILVFMDSCLQHLLTQINRFVEVKLQSLFSWIHVCNTLSRWDILLSRCCCNPCFHGFMSATENKTNNIKQAMKLQSLFSWIHVCNHQ